MKAIVNVSKGSYLYKLNGQTFDVVEVLSNMIALNIDNKTTDFSFNEVIIVDLNKELNNETNSDTVKHNLMKYNARNNYLLN